MESRELGRTGLTVSRLGLGLAALGRPGYINLGRRTDLSNQRDVASMADRTFEALDFAYASGVRYFDAARSYGRAEEFLAGWLKSRKIDPGDAVIGSKWGYTYTAEWNIEAERHEVKDHSLEALLRQSVESRRTLGAYLKLYQIHSATIESGVLEDRNVVEKLAVLRAEGLKIGLSLSGPRQAETLKRALDVEVAGERLFDTVQATWNILESSAGPALDEARKLGVGVIVKEALANGRLSSRNDDPSFAPMRAVLETTAARFGTTIDAIALAASLARPWADVVLSGAATVDQLKSNLKSLDVSWNDELEMTLGSLAESPEVYWKTRSTLPWN
ncbi:MAG: aldo/keto reductase [Isosphaeraceae bacterium]